MPRYEIERCDLDNFIEGTMRKVRGIAKDAEAIAGCLFEVVERLMGDDLDASQEDQTLRTVSRRLAVVMKRLGEAARDGS